MVETDTLDTAYETIPDRPADLSARAAHMCEMHAQGWVVGDIAQWYRIGREGEAEIRGYLDSTAGRAYVAALGANPIYAAAFQANHFISLRRVHNAVRDDVLRIRAERDGVPSA